MDASKIGSIHLYLFAQQVNDYNILDRPVIIIIVVFKLGEGNE